ncbi:hypothetical protein V5799_015263 [Amblyomma americanum]|uniref:Uncharacterized protein n=1 Tax=Amblyomma americanum TaxID=6943 RepID=A0AAQ4E0N3_AMBAM
MLAAGLAPMLHASAGTVQITRLSLGHVAGGSSVPSLHRHLANLADLLREGGVVLALPRRCMHLCNASGCNASGHRHLQSAQRDFFSFTVHGIKEVMLTMQEDVVEPVLGTFHWKLPERDIVPMTIFRAVKLADAETVCSTLDGSCTAIVCKKEVVAPSFPWLHARLEPIKAAA